MATSTRSSAFAIAIAVFAAIAAVGCGLKQEADKGSDLEHSLKACSKDNPEECQESSLAQVQDRAISGILQRLDAGEKDRQFLRDKIKLLEERLSLYETEKDQMDKAGGTVTETVTRHDGNGGDDGAPKIEARPDVVAATNAAVNGNRIQEKALAGHQHAPSLLEKSQETDLSSGNGTASVATTCEGEVIGYCTFDNSGTFAVEFTKCPIVSKAFDSGGAKNGEIQKVVLAKLTNPAPKNLWKERQVEKLEKSRPTSSRTCVGQNLWDCKCPMRGDESNPGGQQRYLKGWAMCLKAAGRMKAKFEMTESTDVHKSYAPDALPDGGLPEVRIIYLDDEMKIQEYNNDLVFNGCVQAAAAVTSPLFHNLVGQKLASEWDVDTFVAIAQAPVSGSLGYEICAQQGQGWASKFDLQCARKESN